MKKYMAALAIACAVSGSSFASYQDYNKSDAQKKDERKHEALRAGLSTFVAGVAFSLVPVGNFSPEAKSAAGSLLGGSISYVESRNSTQSIDRTSQNLGGIIGSVLALVVVSALKSMGGNA